jgi:hypothetical protein
VGRALAAEARTVLFTPELLQLELRQVLALHGSGYEPGESVKLGKLLTALRRMSAGLHANKVARARALPPTDSPAGTASRR